MSGFKIYFIHGYTASSQADWYPQISKDLKKLDIDFVVPDLPGGRHPHAIDWLETLHKEIQKTDKPIVLVGHSLGTRAALLYLEKYHSKVEQVFLIAAFANRIENANRHDDGQSYEDFFEHKINLETIKPLVGRFIVLHSKDDSAIEYAQGVEIAKDLEAELISFDDRDHFSGPENAKYILQVLKDRLIM